MRVELRPVGERAVLAEVGAQGVVLALHAALAASPPVGVRDLVPAARTVLATFDPGAIAVSTVRAWIADAAAGASEDAADPGPLVELPVRYDGPDLADTAALLGLSVAGLVARHRDAEWSVAFTGFAPGFAYLVSADWPFDVPRLPTPRTRVPAGAVGLAAGFSGAYPRATPGGWRLIATTDAALFDPRAADPVLLPPGARVRFVDAPAPAPAPDSGPVPPARPPLGPREYDAPARIPREAVVSPGDGILADSTSPGGADPRSAGAGARIRVDDPGLLATVQDLGRDGRAALGIARSGALDRGALRRANRLVGNAEDAAGIEITLGGFRATARDDLWVVLSGAFGAAAIDGHPIDRDVAVRWPDGAALHVDGFTAGVRAVLAVRGGVVAEPVAGSRATDVLAGLGPAPLAAGDTLAIGATPADPIPVSDLAPWGPPPADLLEIGLAAGPRAEWFAASALRTLFEAQWTVGGDADRVGMRLEGPELARLDARELPSEGMVPGALQVPPSGRPVILLADGPVTGGYPVIAVVADASLDALAQARPGMRLRFFHARP